MTNLGLPTVPPASPHGTDGWIRVRVSGVEQARPAVRELDGARGVGPRQVQELVNVHATMA